MSQKWIRNSILRCKACALRSGCKKPVPGEGKDNALIVLIGEAPGVMEDRFNRPFVGPSGKELDVLLKRFAKIPRDLCYVTNTVKCHPPRDQDPANNQIAACAGHLRRELEELFPKIVVTLGAVATRSHFGQDFDLESHHGFVYDGPKGTPLEGHKVMPMYHPALGMHDTGKMIPIQGDFRRLGEALRLGVSKYGVPSDVSPETTYEALTDKDLNYINQILPEGLPVAVDTEITEDKPWCLTFSVQPGEAFLIKWDQQEALKEFNRLLQQKRNTYLHNALFDLGVLRRMGVHPASVHDTMVMAYLLQDEPQGLKTLAYRKCGVRMSEYMQTVSPATQAKALAYYRKIRKVHWPDAEPYMVYEDGEIKTKNPWSLNTKIQRALDSYNRLRALDDFVLNPLYEVVKRTGNFRAVHPLLTTSLGSHKTLDSLVEAAEGKLERSEGVDFYSRFQNWDDEDRLIVEGCVGKLWAGNLSDIPFEDALVYACRDADVTMRIAPLLWERIEKLELVDPYYLDIQVMGLVDQMQHYGMKIDPDHMIGLTKIFDEEMEKRNTVIQGFADCSVNLASSEQLKGFLFGQLGLNPPLKKISKKTGQPSIDGDVLQSMIDMHPSIPLVKEWKMFDKLKTTYSRQLPLKMDKDDRVHTDLRMTRTSTGRLASSGPNLQNIPARTKEGKMIREGFIADDGCSLVSGDYSQIEMRMVAHLSGDELMKEIFDNDFDIHTRTASAIFGIPEERVDDMRHRKPAKTTGFGTLYGISPDGLLVQLQSIGCEGWDVEKCERMIRDWFAAFWGVKRYFREVRGEAKRNGYVRDFLGRLRRIPEVRSANRHIVEAGERQACSMVVQGGAQEILKMCMRDMISVVHKWTEWGYVCKPVLQIHDELLFEVEDEIVDCFCEDFKEKLDGAIELDVPIKSDIEVGKNWGEVG